MPIQSSYSGEVRFVRSNHSSRSGTTITLALPDTDELSKVTGMDGKRYMLALVEIGDDEQPVQPVQKPEKSVELRGGALSILASRWCQSLEFIEFIRPIYDRVMGGNGSRWGDVTPDDFANLPGNKYELYAAHCIKVICDCEQSRRELGHDPRKAELFQQHIRGPFIKYMASVGVREPTPRPKAKSMEAHA
jgi:hypothetical protein